MLLDLTAFGRNLTLEQWYESLRDRIGRQLHLEDELEEYANQMSRVSPLQRWVGAITDVVLPRLSGKLVIFLDEIDFAKSLPFSTDEWFSAIRACYNRRVLDAELNRLTFCLLGVASPSDLIRDSRTTPFNIGRRIELTDFTREEAEPLTPGLGHDPAIAAMVLTRVLYWTGGHPYLTQRLCRAAAECHAATNEGVDRLCEELFLSTRARSSDDNLLFAREQMLRGEVDRASLLTLYGRIREGKRVPDDPTNHIVSVMRLSGVIRARTGHLTVSNRIYSHVFDRAWVEANMPDQERRRQRAAYRRGLLKAGVVATGIIGAVAGLAVWAVFEQQTAVTALKLVDRQKQAVEAKNVEVETKNHEVEQQKKEVEAKNREVEAEKAIADARRRDAEAAQDQIKKEQDRSAQLKHVSDEAMATVGTSTHDARMRLAQSYVARGDVRRGRQPIRRCQKQLRRCRRRLHAGRRDPL